MEERLARLEVLLENTARSIEDTRAAISHLTVTVEQRLEKESDKRSALERQLLELTSESKLLRAGVVFALLSGGGAVGTLVSKIIGGT